MKKALITGITGQDGSYLAEFLLSKGYEVHGMVRRSSTFNTQRVNHIYMDTHEPEVRLFLHYGDLTDTGVINSLIHRIQPDEVYHLAAQSHVRVSFDMPEYTGNVTGVGTTRILEALRINAPHAKFYQASSSEMFGNAVAPQSEKTPFEPCSPYAAAKAYGYWMTVNYRQSYGMFACNGILFNHESPRRGETFVTRKITRAIAAMCAGKQQKLYLGNLDAKRDWGFAPEYVEMMWLMLQHHRPDDYVVGTGQSCTVRAFVEQAFAYVGIELAWEGAGDKEKAVVLRDNGAYSQTAFVPGTVLIEIDPRYYRPTEVEHLQADISKARAQLCWEPRVTFDDLVRIMVDYDLVFANMPPIGEGIKVGGNKGFTYTTHHMLSNVQEHESVW
jgi:GDPmannose 4,6-dehydratase